MSYQKAKLRKEVFTLLCGLGERQRDTYFKSFPMGKVFLSNKEPYTLRELEIMKEQLAKTIESNERIARRGYDTKSD